MSTLIFDSDITVSGSIGSLGDQVITGSLEATADITASIFKGDGSTITSLNGTNISSGTIAAARVATLNQDTTGTAAKATILENTRTINGVDFNGSTDITTVEGNTSGTGAGGTLNMITIGTTEYSVATGTGNGNVETSGTPANNDYARFTSGYQVEGRSFTEVRTDLNIEDGADVTPSWVPSVNPNYLTSVGTINLTSGVTGILPVGNGGTGVNTVTAGRILIGNGTSALATDSGFTYNTSNKLLSAPTASFDHLIVNQIISASVINTSGSNIFGDEATDTQTLNGSVVLNNISTDNSQTTALFIDTSPMGGSNTIKKRTLQANAFTSTTIPVIANTSVTDLNDVTSAGSGIIITGAERTTIGTNTSGISSNTSAISGKAASGANSDITSLSGLTTALSVAQGGTGQDAYTAGRILIGNGSSAFATDSGFTYASSILSIENMLKMSGETIISKSNAIFTIGDTDGNDGVEQIDFRVMGTNPLSVLDGEVAMTIGSLNSEETSVMINNSGQVGTRELGSNAFTSTTIPVIANTSVTDLNDVTSAGSGIIITAAERTAIGTNTSGISSNTSAISGKAASGANSDITSLSGLTTALSVAQGGTGTTNGGITATGNITTTGAITAGSPLTIKSSNPFIQWQNASATRLAYIQHSTDLVYNADTGIHVFNQNLKVVGGNPDVYFTSADTGQSDLYFGGVTAPTKGNIKYSDNADAFMFNVNTSTEAMRIISSGNVGIGTASPTYKLDLAGSFRIGANGTANDSYPINFTNAAVAIARDNNDLELHAYNAIVFGVSTTSYPTSTERMRISSAGDVGIGTPSPTKKLDIRGDVLIQNTNATLNINGTGEETSNSMIDFYQESTLSTRILVSKDSNFDFLTVDPSNNLQRRLHIGGEDGQFQFNAYTATATSAGATALTPNQNFQASTDADTLATLTVDPSGNVVRGSQEATWTFTNAQLNALTNTRVNLLSAPGAGKAIVVEESNWLMVSNPESTTGAFGSDLTCEIIGVTANQVATQMVKARMEEISVPAFGGVGIYSRDVPELNRVYRFNVPMTIRSKNGTNQFPARCTSIALKIKYRVYDSSTF